MHLSAPWGVLIHTPLPASVGMVKPASCCSCLSSYFTSSSSQLKHLSILPFFHLFTEINALAPSSYPSCLHSFNTIAHSPQFLLSVSRPIHLPNLWSLSHRTQPLVRQYHLKILAQLTNLYTTNLHTSRRALQVRWHQTAGICIIIIILLPPK